MKQRKSRVGNSNENLDFPYSIGRKAGISKLFFIAPNPIIYTPNEDSKKLVEKLVRILVECEWEGVILKLETPIYVAVGFANVKLCQFIFKENIDDANVKNSKLSPWTLLEFAATLGHVDVVNLLLSIKNIESDIIGPWPLVLAAEYGQFEVVKVLAPYSGNPNSWVDADGKFAIDLAAETKNSGCCQHSTCVHDIIKFLIQYIQQKWHWSEAIGNQPSQLLEDSINRNMHLTICTMYDFHDFTDPFVNP